MVLLRSVPSLCLLAAGVILGLLSRHGRFGRAAAYGCIACANGLTVLILMAGGTLFEALACLLPLLFLTLPKGETT